MSRIPVKPRSELSAEEQAAHDKLDSITRSAHGSAFIRQDDNGAFLGPFPAYIAQPDVGIARIDFYSQFSKMSGLPADARETAILAVGAIFQAKYELYAHANVAVKKAGIDVAAVREICQGQKPQGLSEQCGIAYDVATYLAGTSGPLPSALWEQAVQCFGRHGALSLVNYVGFYAFTCITLNAIDAPVPNDNDSVI